MVQLVQCTLSGCTLLVEQLYCSLHKPPIDHKLARRIILLVDLLVISQSTFNRLTAEFFSVEVT